VTEHSKALARLFVERFLNTGDPAALEDLVVPGYVDHDLPAGVTPAVSIGLFRAGFPDAVFTAEDVLADGDRVAVRYRIDGTHTGDFFGMPPTGRKISIGGISIYRVRDGRLAEAWVQYDQAGLVRQVQGTR
jgi:ketosteroid isomerase-like protein